MIPDIFLHLRHHLHLSGSGIAVADLHELDGVFFGQQRLQVGVFPAAPGQPQQSVRGASHRPEQPHREVIVQDLAGAFQQRPQNGPVVLALLFGQAEQHVAAQDVRTGHIAGQVILQGIFQHPRTGETQLQLLGRRHFGVGAQNAGRHQIAVALQVDLHVPQRLPQFVLVLKQPRIQPHKKAFLIGAHALRQIFLDRQLPQQGALLLDLFSRPGQRTLQILRGQIQLDQIVHHAGSHGLLDVIEFLKAGQHDERRQRAALPAGAGQGQAVHQGHFHICHHDVRLLALDQL